MVQTWGKRLTGKLKDVSLDAELTKGQALKINKTEKITLPWGIYTAEQVPNTPQGEKKILDGLLDGLPKEGFEVRYAKVRGYWIESGLGVIHYGADIEVHVIVKEASPIPVATIILAILAIIGLAFFLATIITTKQIAKEFYEWTEEPVGGAISLMAIISIMIIAVAFFILFVWRKRR